MRILVILFCVFCLFATNYSSEVFVNNEAKEFLIGFLPSTQSFISGVQLVLISTSTNNISITTSDSTPGIVKQVNESMPAVITFPGVPPFVINGRPLHVFSEEYKFTVVASLQQNGITASYLALPNQILLCREYEYFTIHTSSSSPAVRSAGALLIAAENDTHVTYTLPSDQSYEGYFELNSTESYFIDELIDITGTKIVSDKPLTVISGHEAGSVPFDGTLEPMAQQIPPTQLWGEKFMIVPFSNHPMGQIIKILSSVNNTKIDYNCNSVKSDTILSLAGDSHQFLVNSNTYCYIEANNSVLIAQFPYSPNGNTDGDTTMILVASIDQYSREFYFEITDTVHNDYISIFVPVNHYDPNGILYDEQVIENAEWKPIYDIYDTVVGYGCRLSVSTGLHTVKHTNTDGRLFVMVYGFSTSKAYGYPAGLTFDSSKVLGLKFTNDNYDYDLHGSSVEVQVIRTKPWILHAIFTLIAYTCTEEIVSYLAVTIYPENNTIPLQLTIHEQGNYSIELCCINNTVQDVCIHSKLTLNNKTTNEVSSVKFSNTLKPFSTIDSLSTVGLSTTSSYKHSMTNSIQMSSIIIMDSSLKQTVQESPVYSSYVAHNSLKYQNNSVSLKHVQESPVYSSHMTHNKLTNQNTGNSATPSVVGLSEPTAISFTILNMGLISVIGLMILLLIILPVVVGYLCYRKGGKNSIVLINPEGSGSAITITTLKTMHKIDLRVSEVGAPSDLNNGHDVEEIETRFAAEEVEQEEESVTNKLSVVAETVTTEDEIDAPATYELEEKIVEPNTSHDAVEIETSFTKKDESTVELEDQKSVDSKLSVAVEIATEDEVIVPTYRLEETNLEPTTSHDAVDIESSFTTDDKEKLIKEKLKMD